jgi:hypothetical protein
LDRDQVLAIGIVSTRFGGDDESEGKRPACDCAPQPDFNGDQMSAQHAWPRNKRMGRRSKTSPKRMIADHGKANDRLKQLTEADNIPVPSGIERRAPGDAGAAEGNR